MIKLLGSDMCRTRDPVRTGVRSPGYLTTSLIYDTIKEQRQMASSGGRLSPAVDEYSDVSPGGYRHKTIGTAPQYSSCVNNRYGAGPTLNRREANEGASTMAKRTRTSGRSDSRTRATAVNITPATQSTGPVTTTPTIA